MYQLKLVKDYKSKLSLRDTERAIKLLKDGFEAGFGNALNLERISAPMLVPANSGINDDLNGTERPVRFSVKEIEGTEAEVVHSLAKWKRIALFNYGFKEGEGLYTDMNAIRRDDSLDNIHSIYVDQWDWELVIGKKDRNIEFLKKVVSIIAKQIFETKNALSSVFPCLTAEIKKEVYFITADELYNSYPNLTAKERENLIVKQHKTVFIIGIGKRLASGLSHDGRAPDYDDWDLNGDLLYYNGVLDEAIEISSMGIRVDAISMEEQLAAAGKEERRNYEYHKGVLSGKFPLTAGGGIGQSRLCQLLLEKLHIGEVQVSLWPEDMLKECRKAGILIL